MKYKIFARYNIEKYIGEFEGDMPEDAIEQAEDQGAGEKHIQLCSRCAGEFNEDTAYQYEYFAVCDW